MNVRIGIGYDIHRLIRKRTFILGGIKIDYPKGFLAHSDGDVLFHALIDSLLGALALGDIGQLFPDTDPIYKNANSADLLIRTLKLIPQERYLIGNIDINIICQAPKLAPYITAIRENIAKLLNISKDNISIKAKTKEKVDAVGKGKAVEVFCGCTIIDNLLP